jgi:uncharacterized protein (UPF0335 family)
VLRLRQFQQQGKNMTETGHNSNAQLKALVERINREEDAKKEVADGIKDIYAEAKSHGYDVKQLRRTVAISRQDPQKRAEADAILATYMLALGMS